MDKRRADPIIGDRVEIRGIIATLVEINGDIAIVRLLDGAKMEVRLNHLLKLKGFNEE